jgi:HEPN domain-containing protein
LHQAAESFYNTALLVFTSYKPKTHNLGKLKKQIKSISLDLYLLFPEDNITEQHLFDLLKRGYIDARYKDDYVIAKEEVVILLERITKMKHLIETICVKQIVSLN